MSTSSQEPSKGLLALAGIPHHQALTSRRDFFQRSGLGFGSVALTGLLNQSAQGSHVAPRKPHQARRAKNVIFLFMEGGPSHIDTFDPKPLVNRLAGQKVPESFGRVLTSMGESHSPILASQRQWKRHGQSGLWVSDWCPHVAECIDDIAVIRSCVSDGINHAGGVCQMNTGSIVGGRPSLGSWVTYGLGSENQDLPSFVVMTDTESQVVNGPRMWGTGFIPSVHQGVRFKAGETPIQNLNAPKGVSSSRQSGKLAFLQHLNKTHAHQRNEDSVLEARINSYELAFRMQAEAPDAVDLSKESDSTKALYGMDRQPTANFGRMCLLARRLVERGVRFVQLYHGAGSKWDAHAGIEKNHTQNFAATDLPVAGLLKDLKSRGLLEETLVVWGGEFGRTPMSEDGDGRDHNPTGFTLWMAGGGVQGGQTIGRTDDLGLHAIEDRMHVLDIHSTIVWLLGLDPRDLVYHHKGRPENPARNEGEPNPAILG